MRTTAGVAIPLIVGLALGSPASGAAAATGAICAGFASQQGVYRTRAAAMLWTASAMAISTFVGGVAAYSLPALVLVTALWGFAYGLLASLGPAATAVGINATIALIVFSHFKISVPQVAGESLLVLAGGLVQTFLLVSVWPLRRFSVERHALAGVARNLAAYARALVRGELDVPDFGPIATVREALADPQPFASRGDIGAFQALLDADERIRASLAALVTDRARSGDPRPIDELVLATAGLLESMASALDAGVEPSDRDADWARFEDAEARIEAAAPKVGGHVHHAAHALAGQLRAAWRLVDMPAADVTAGTDRGAVAPITFPRFADTLATLRANLPVSSPYGRLAIRLAGTLALAALIGGIIPSQHGYWVAMTAAILLKPDFTTTFVRGVGRIGGTLLGAVIATVIATHVHPGAAAYAALCIFFAGAGYLIFNANYALFTIAITSYVGFALAVLGQPEESALVDRVVATLAAGALAGVAVLIWPTWESGRARTALAALLDANRRYARVVLDAFADPARYDPQALAAAQASAWSSRGAAEASVDRMLGEPARTHGIEAERALGILAASRRLGLATLSLNAHFVHADHILRPALDQLKDAIDDGLRCAIEALREGAECGSYPHLRDAYRTLKNALRASGDRDAGMILFEADALVDSVNTVAELVRP